MLKEIKMDNENIHILGRTKLGKEIPLFWTGSGFELVTDSSEVWIDFELDYSINEYWVRVELDGVTMQKVLLTKDRTTICAYRNLPNDKRCLRFMLISQPQRLDHDRYFLLKGVRLNGEIYKAPQKDMKIEVVGDSLSSGEGLSGAATLLGAGTTSYGLDGHYAITLADRFNADLRILSQSGWGVYTSWDNCADRVMPKYYDDICTIVTGEVSKKLGAFEKNDFKAWQPDVVIINLGSNDGFALDNEGWTDPETGKFYKQERNEYGGLSDETAKNFENACVDFLKKVRDRNPNALIIWAFGMCDHRMSPYVEKAVSIYKENTKDDKTYYQSLPSSTKLHLGSNGHPGIKDHLFAADILEDLIKSIL